MPETPPARPQTFPSRRIGAASDQKVRGVLPSILIRHSDKLSTACTEHVAEGFSTTRARTCMHLAARASSCTCKLQCPLLNQPFRLSMQDLACCRTQRTCHFGHTTSYQPTLKPQLQQTTCPPLQKGRQGPSSQNLTPGQERMQLVFSSGIRSVHCICRVLG